ncbi:MAG: GHKL domain-containing protein [Lachnospiraceae bacterium]|nr:GHKL domain-containing protein [Lachnospiraceae bacterium]
MDFFTFYNRTDFAIFLLLSEYLICHRYGKRNLFGLRLLFSTAIPLWIAFFWSRVAALHPFLWMGAAKYLVIFLVSILSIFLSFQGDIWAALFAGVTGYCLQHISYQSAYLIRLFHPIPLSAAGELLLSFAIWVVWAVLLHVSYLRHMESNTPVQVNNRLQATLSAIILTIMIFLALFGIVYAHRSGDKGAVVVTLLFSILSCLLALMLEFSLVRLNQKETEMAILEHMVEKAKSQYQLSKENIETINIKCHDLRHQIRQLDCNIDPAELSKISDALRIYEANIRTGNDALDIILMEKKLLCSNKMIRLTCMMDSSVIDGMHYSDIYSLFGNAIDNAIEAVSALDESRRSISIHGSRRGKASYIVIENYFDGPLAFKDGLPCTNKTGDYHGFGVKSMKKLAEQYGGELTISLVKDIFRVEILFPEGITYNLNDNKRPKSVI